MSAARTLFALLVLVGALAGSSTALADPPVREPFVFEDFTAAAGEVCSFPLSFEGIRNDVKGTFFSDGRLLVTGQFIGRVTNLSSGKSIEINTSGPGTVRFNEDGTVSIVARGNSLFILFAGLDVGGPALLLTSGRVDFMYSAAGFIASFEPRGNVRDICAALA